MCECDKYALKAQVARIWFMSNNHSTGQGECMWSCRLLYFLPYGACYKWYPIINLVTDNEWPKGARQQANA